MINFLKGEKEVFSSPPPPSCPFSSLFISFKHRCHFYLLTITTFDQQSSWHFFYDKAPELLFFSPDTNRNFKKNRRINKSKKKEFAIYTVKKSSSFLNFKIAILKSPIIVRKWYDSNSSNCERKLSIKIKFDFHC